MSPISPFLCLLLSTPTTHPPHKVRRCQVQVETGHPIRSFTPNQAFGAGIDGEGPDEVSKLFHPKDVAEMRNMGLGPISYRLRTELGIEAWHWNPHGTWSDPFRRQGYWLSDATPTSPILKSYAYALPRRGNTVDQGDNFGYSRLDDDDPNTFWKSNPYLDHTFTGEPNERHPQWVVVDFKKKVPVCASHILWGEPYAVRYRFEYWDGGLFGEDRESPSGHWRMFPKGEVRNGKGGSELRRLCAKPVPTQFVRIWLDEGSRTAAHPVDIRDRLGFAIRELSVGDYEQEDFRDRMDHSPDDGQTVCSVSSTDPWHREADRDPEAVQPGFDALVRSGLTNGQPMLMAAPVLYGVPLDAAREVTWLAKRGIPIRGIELGEEPDGQLVAPEDYGSLYLQMADQIRRVSPKVLLGGPSLQTVDGEFRAWPEPGSKPWLTRFLQYLDGRGRRADLGFFSFEWYPFDDVTEDPDGQLHAHQDLLDSALNRLEALGMGHSIPWVMSEFGYSAFASQAEVEMPSALLNADILGQFLSRGGDSAYLYGYEPGKLMGESPGVFGNLMALLRSEDGSLTRLPAFYSAWLITHIWCGDEAKEHRLLRLRLGGESQSVRAYAVLRPDGRTAILVLNLSQEAPVDLQFKGFRPEVATIYGPAQYHWKVDGLNGHPTRSLPPVRSLISPSQGVELAPFTMAVVQ